MNSETAMQIEECAKEAGALRDCPMCGQLTSAYDPDAEVRAYAIATNAWKDRRRGFRAMQRTEVMDLMKLVLERIGNCAC